MKKLDGEVDLVEGTCKQCNERSNKYTWEGNKNDFSCLVMGDGSCPAALIGKKYPYVDKQSGQVKCALMRNRR
jgi:hypothetical protein